MKCVEITLFWSLTVLLSGILLVGQLYAQDAAIDKPAYQEVTPRTPETASMGTSKASVDTYTGLMSQTVPIYTVSLRELAVPISLSYTSQSPNVQQIAGWVGLGWNLNAGGAIIRERRGIEDDFIYDRNGTGVPDESDPQNGSSLVFPGIPDSDYAKRRSGLLVHAYYNLDLAQGSAMRKAQGIYESQPDLFTLSVSGYSAQFMFDSSANMHVVSDTDLKIATINYDISNPMALPTTSIPGWKVTVPGGTVYEFRAIEKSAPWTYDSTKPSDQRWQLKTSNAPDAWLLTKIISRESGLSIELEYEDYEYDHHGPANETQFRYGYATIGEQIYDYGLIPDMDVTHGTDESRVRIYGKRLTKIRTSTGRTSVEFLSSLATARTDIGNNISAEVLDAIVVRHNPIGDEMKQLSRFDFTYDNATGRLTLRKVQQTGRPSYRFDYIGQIPATTLSKAIDYFGHYNGADDNTTLIPGTNLFPGATRRPNPDYIKNGLLWRVHYPSGSSSEFEYEINDFSWVNGTLKTDTDGVPLIQHGAGVRVKSVVEKSGVRGVPALVRHYTYTTVVDNKTASSGAVVRDAFKFIDLRRIQTVTGYAQTTTVPPPIDDPDPCYGLGPIVYDDNAYVCASLPHRRILYAGGSFVGYSEVKVSQGEDDENGYVVTAHHSPRDVITTFPTTNSLYGDLNPPIEVPSYKFGLVTERRIYTADDQLVQETTSHYRFINEIRIPGYHAATQMLGNDGFCGPARNRYTGIEVAVLLGRPIPDEAQPMTLISHDRSGQVITNYTASETNIHTNKALKQTTVYTSAAPNEHAMTLITYPEDYPSDPLMQTLVAQHRTTVPVEKISYRKKTTPIVKYYLLGGTKNVYERFSGEVRLTKQMFFQLATPVILTSESQLLTEARNHYESEVEIVAYDDVGNVLGTQLRDGRSVSHQFGYGDGHLLIAKVVNADVDEVFHTSFEWIEEPGLWVEDFRDDARTGHRSYQHNNPLNLKTAVDNRQLATGTYRMTYWYRPTGEVEWKFYETALNYQGGDDVYTHSFHGLIDEVRIHPLDAHMTTVTYDGHGNTETVMDMNSIVTAYEYDDFQRLKLVRNDDGDIVSRTQYVLMEKE